MMTLTADERSSISDVDELFNRLQSDEIVDSEPSAWRVWLLDNAKPKPSSTADQPDQQ
jgi:hypothetical protein